MHLPHHVPFLGRRLRALTAFLAGVFACLALHAQSTGTIAGRVTDAQTKLALGGARVTVTGTDLSTFADSSGVVSAAVFHKRIDNFSYQITLPPGS